MKAKAHPPILDAYHFHGYTLLCLNHIFLWLYLIAKKKELRN